MPHLSRLLSAICAITVILVSLPTNAEIGDKDLPLLNGQKTKLLYTVVGVKDYADLATSKNVLCSATLVEFFNSPATSMVMLPVFRATKQGGM
jgi:hypothetical protein